MKERSHRSLPSLNEKNRAPARTAINTNESVQWQCARLQRERGRKDAPIHAHVSLLKTNR
jgi:hypothetical protein